MTRRSAIVRDLYAALTAGDLPRVLAALTEDVVFHIPGTGVNAGDWRGPRGVLAMLAQAQQLTRGTLSIELRDVLEGSSDDVVALATYRAEREGGATLENHLAHVLRFRDGRVQESWFHARDQYAVDAFWAPRAVGR